MKKSKNNTKKVFIILIIMLIVLTFLSKSLYNYRLPVVSVVLPKQGQINHEVDGKAQIRYAHTQSVYTPIDGRIRAIMVQEGENVKRGQCIMQIESTEGMELRNIEAEEDGIIISVGIMTGMYVSVMQNVTLYEIAEQSEEWLCSFVISEEEAELISSDSVVEAILVGDSSVIEGKVLSITAYEDSRIAGYQVNVLIKSENQSLAEKRANIKIKDNGRVYDVLVPVSALNKDSEGYYVFGLEKSESILNKGYCVRRISVELLESDENYCAIRGVANDEIIIVQATAELHSGSAVYYEG